MHAYTQDDKYLHSLPLIIIMPVSMWLKMFKIITHLREAHTKKKTESENKMKEALS